MNAAVRHDVEPDAPAAARDERAAEARKRQGRRPRARVRGRVVQEPPDPGLTVRGRVVQEPPEATS